MILDNHHDNHHDNHLDIHLDTSLVEERRQELGHHLLLRGRRGLQGGQGEARPGAQLCGRALVVSQKKRIISRAFQKLYSKASATLVLHRLLFSLLECF